MIKSFDLFTIPKAVSIKILLIEVKSECLLTYLEGRVDIQGFSGDWIDFVAVDGGHGCRNHDGKAHQ